MKANQGAEREFENPTPGSHSAVCYKIVDVGTQEDNYQGKKTSARKAYIFWELSDRTSEGQRFSVFQSYTLSMGKKANLRKLINNWRGTPLTDEQAEAFQMEKLLGAFCIVKLVEKNDKIYVASGGDGVGHLEQKLWPVMPPIEPENEKSIFSLDPGEFDIVAFHALPEWLKKKIIQSPEWDALQKAKNEAATPSGTPAAPSPAEGAMTPEQLAAAAAKKAPVDDIPF